VEEYNIKAERVSFDYKSAAVGRYFFFKFTGMVGNGETLIFYSHK